MKQLGVCLPSTCCGERHRKLVTFLGTEHVNIILMESLKDRQKYSSLLELVFVHQLWKDLAPPAMGAPTAKVIIIDTDIDCQYTNKTGELCRLLCRLNATLIYIDMK